MIILGSSPYPGDSETTLSARLPEDPPNTAADADLSSASFTPLYRTDAEWAAELSSRTVHAVMHLAWIGQGEGRYRGQLGVYVRPRGRAGAACMALIAPLRHHAVCPALIRRTNLEHPSQVACHHNERALLRWLSAAGRKLVW